MRVHPGLIRTVPFLLAAALTACSGESQSPTAPDFEKSLAPATAPAAAASEKESSAVATSEQAEEPVVAAAAGGKGKPAKPPKPPKPPDNGNGNGNGGNGNGHGGGGNDNNEQGELRVELQPDTWNTNWDHSQGSVSALLKGQGLGDIDPSSIVLIGTDGAEAPLPAERVQTGGNHLRAFFSKADAIDTLDTPTRGETHVVTIRFVADGQIVELTASVRIVGPAVDQGDDDEGDDEEDEEELSLAIQPDTWNTNWARSAGTVSALLRGSDLDSIALDSIFLIGTDPAAAPLAPLRVQRTGNHVRAFFAKSAALATLDTPVAGERHDVEIHFTDASGPVELVDSVRIVGPGN